MKIKLQFTNEYYPKFEQISRILHILASQDQNKKLTTTELSTSLGIPIQQGKSYLSMMDGFGLIHSKTKTLTMLGNYIIQHDPFFEKIETLWIIHFNVSSNTKLIIWNRIINKIYSTISREPFTTNQIIRQYFHNLAEYYSRRTFTKKIPGEIRAVLYAYTRSSFSSLKIFQEDGRNNFSKCQPDTIPILVFLYSLLYFREKYFPGSTALTFDDICYANNSPGKVLLLSEDQVRSKLEDLHDAGLIRLEKFANLNQTRFIDSVTCEFVLKRIYEGHDIH